MPRQTLVERKDGRYVCKFDSRCFYGKTQEEALRKRDKYLIDCGIGYDPNMAEVPFLEYGLAWLGAYRSECNSMQRRMYENMITSAAEILKKKYLRMINATDIRCHDFRVSFCTMCYEAGIPIKTLQSWTGHSDAKMIMEVYAKLSSEKEQFDASKLDEFMQKRYNQ